MYFVHLQTDRWEPPIQVLNKYIVKHRVIDSCHDFDSSKHAINVNEQNIGKRENAYKEIGVFDADDAEMHSDNEDEVHNIVYVNIVYV